jgi:hypothetical protein
VTEKVTEKPVPVVEAQVAKTTDEDDEEEEGEASEIEIDGIMYLIDDENQLYDHESQEFTGKVYNRSTGEIQCGDDL